MNNVENNVELPVVLYTSSDGQVRVNVLVKDESIWMTQAGMAELFVVQKTTISKHLKNIFESRELVEDMVFPPMETTSRHVVIYG